DNNDAISRQLPRHGSEPVAANVFEDGEAGNTAGHRATETRRVCERIGPANGEGAPGGPAGANLCLSRACDAAAKCQAIIVATVSDRGSFPLDLMPRPATAATALALGELEAFARSRLAGFLPPFHARIAPAQTLRFTLDSQILS